MALVVLAAASWLPSAPSAGAAEDPLVWTVELGTLNPPYRDAAGVSALAMGESGKRLVVGLTNGGILFLNAEDGSIEDSAFVADRGAVRSISLDKSGDRAAFVYESGYMAVLDVGQEDPLLTRHADPSNTDPGIQQRAAAALTPDGAFLIVTDDRVHLYHAKGEAGARRFVEVDDSNQQVGPFLYVHPVFRAFGGLSSEGLVAIYTFTADALTLQGRPTPIPTGADGPVTSLSASADGGRFAITHNSGTIRRYQPSLIPGEETLVLDLEEKILGRPKGVALSENGVRLVAWSEREVLWIEGRNRNVPQDEATATAATATRLRPDPEQRFTEVDTSANLLRLLARSAGPDGKTRLYNMPELDSFVVADVATSLDASLVDAAGDRVFQAAGARLDAYRITEEQLAPPAQTSSDPGTTGNPATGSDNTATEDDGLFGSSALLVAGGGVALLLIAVLVALLVVAVRGRGAVTTLPALDPSQAEAAAPVAATTLRGAAAPARARSVPVAQPPTAAAPEGLLVMEALTIRGSPALVGLSASWKRPGVVRVYGAPPALVALREGLTGRRAVSGLLAAGGASAEETSILFARRVQVGLLGIDATQDAATLYRSVAQRHGHPASLVETQLSRDLGWLGARLAQPVASLRALDRWKVRFALTLVHRPSVVLLAAAESRPEGGAGAAANDIVGQVLGGVARQYQTLILVLDDGSGPDAATLRTWCTEEMRLDAGGFRDRRLLEDGRPVSPGDRNGRRRRRT